MCSSSPETQPTYSTHLAVCHRENKTLDVGLTPTTTEEEEWLATELTQLTVTGLLLHWMRHLWWLKDNQIMLEAQFKLRTSLEQYVTFVDKTKNSAKPSSSFLSLTFSALLHAHTIFHVTFKFEMFYDLMFFLSVSSWRFFSVALCQALWAAIHGIKGASCIIYSLSIHFLGYMYSPLIKTSKSGLSKSPLPCSVDNLTNLAKEGDQLCSCAVCVSRC